MPPIRTRIASLAFAAILAAPAAAAAQSSQGGEAGASSNPNPVVAVVNGEEVRFAELMESARDLPRQYQQQLSRILPRLIDRLVDMKLAAQAAQKAGLGDDAEVQKRLAELKKDVMRDVYLQRQVDEYVTDERLQAAYETYLDKEGAKKEVKARHILVESEDRAKELIVELEGGADFVELAKEHSTGPSAQNGGDLGYFAKGQMVPAFEKAAFKLETGEFTKEPVKSDFGWHVIKVTDRRQKDPKGFEEMKPNLTQKLQREAIEKALADLREDAEVKTYPERVKEITGGSQGGGQSSSQSGGQN